MFHQVFIIIIQIMNIISQSGATFHREFITRIGSPMRLLQQSVQLLGRHPNLLIQQLVQGTISESQEEIETRSDRTQFSSHILSCFPDCWKGNWLHYHLYFLSGHHFSSHTILMSIMIIIWEHQDIPQRIVFLSRKRCKHLLRLER